MSYTVEYNPELRKSYPMKSKKNVKIPFKPIVVALFTIAFLYVLNTFGVLRLLLPGDPAVTAGAFSSMVADVRDGHRVSDAVFSFFQSVIKGGQ